MTWQRTTRRTTQDVMMMMTDFMGALRKHKTRRPNETVITHPPVSPVFLYDDGDDEIISILYSLHGQRRSGRLGRSGYPCLFEIPERGDAFPAVGFRLRPASLARRFWTLCLGHDLREMIG